MHKTLIKWNFSLKKVEGRKVFLWLYIHIFFSLSLHSLFALKSFFYKKKKKFFFYFFFLFIFYSIYLFIYLFFVKLSLSLSVFICNKFHSTVRQLRLSSPVKTSITRENNGNNAISLCEKFKKLLQDFFVLFCFNLR